MAIYTDLQQLRGSSTADVLRQKILVALLIKANDITKLATTAQQRTFATAALSNPETYLNLILNYILAEYKTSTTAVIIGATDSQVQTAVDNAVTTLLGV